MFERTNIDFHVPFVVFLVAHFVMKTNQPDVWIAALLLVITLAYSFLD